MRISRALALAGIDSRRKCEIHVQNGAVTVNGEVVRDLGRQVDPENDHISFRGKTLFFEKFVYYLLYKPEGYTTTALDAHADKTVFELLPSRLISGSLQPKPNRIRVFPVGRLDRDSSGLLLFTNDGDFAHQLMHPSFGVEKWYEVRLDRAFEAYEMRKLLEGVQLEDGPARAEKVDRLSRRVIRLMIREGRKREVRRMFEALGYEVMKLCRISFGPFMLGDLVPGEGRYLKDLDIKKVKKTLKLPAKVHPSSKASGNVDVEDLEDFSD